MSREEWTLVLVVGGLLAAATLVGAVVLAARVRRVRRLLGDLGAGGKFAFYGALAYTILPVDLLPDPIYLDDMGILAGALFYLTRLAQRRHAAQTGASRTGTGRGETSHSEAGQSGTDGTGTSRGGAAGHRSRLPDRPGRVPVRNGGVGGTVDRPTRRERR